MSDTVGSAGDGPELVGGDVAVDFVNTVAWRLDSTRRTDRVANSCELLNWTVGVGLLDGTRRHEFHVEADADPSLAATVVTQSREFRESLYRLLLPLTAAAEPDSDDVEIVQQAITGALAKAVMHTVVPLRWSLPLHGLADLPSLLAFQAWRILESEDLSRLRQCADNGCGWLFLDRSRNASRRWCSSADCGNRARARRHYQQQRDRHPSARSRGGPG